MSAIRPTLSPLLVGRDELLGHAEALIAEAAAGRGSALLLAGEAGIGKSRLLRAIVRKADAAGFRISGGDLAPSDREVPLASILDMARGIRRKPAFGDLGESLLAVHRGRGADNLGSRRLFVREVADMIVDAIDRPTGLAFEDLQWADELSLEVVAELARLCHDRPLLVIGAYRADELPTESIHREWRARLLTQRFAEEARLEPLSYEQTALVTTLILGTGLPAPREVVKAVFERTEGVPLYVEELLGALDEEARTDDHAIRQVVVPGTIEAAVLARASRLSDDARAVAAAGAVIGRCFEPFVLAGIMDRPVSDLEEPLDELVRTTFLYPFEFLDRGYYDFRHQLLRDSLYATVPPRDLRRLHARAAEFGAQLVGATEIHASVHFERAGLRMQAYRAALSGAEAAMALSSRREAFELYRRAIANLPPGLPPAEVGRVYQRYTEAAFAIDNVAVAVDAAEHARRSYLDAGLRVPAATALLDLLVGWRRDSRPLAERARIVSQAEAELLSLPESVERTEALAILRDWQGDLALDAGRIDDARALFGESIQLRTPSDPAASADAALMQGMCDVAAGDIRGVERMLEAARQARDAGAEATGVTAYRMAAAYAARAMDYAGALKGLDEGLRYADEIEQSYCRRIIAATAAHIAWAAGRWDEAATTAELELAEPGSRRASVAASDALAYVAFGRGELDRAEVLLQESLAIGRPCGEAELILPALWGSAETALLRARPAVAFARCEEALELARTSCERWLLVPFVVIGVRAALADRRPQAAAAWLTAVREHLTVIATAAQSPLAHADGLLELGSGSPGSARPHLEAAVEGWEARGRTWEALWARADLARCLVRSGRHLHALPIVQRIRVDATALGSIPLIAEADAIERQARRRATPVEPWAPLTTREYEVARHIAAGKTNKDVAQELGVAPKTVSAHVEHILAKLGVNRRAEIAAWATSVAQPSAVDARLSGGVGPAPVAPYAVRP